MATAHRRTSSGLNSSSGGELKLYLKGKRNTFDRLNTLDKGTKFTICCATCEQRPPVISTAGL